MTSYEYKVVPAPQRGQKARGVKSSEARFALAIERVMNEMAEGGWEYHRTDTLPCEERGGLTSGITTYRSMLIFRRARAGDVAAFQPRRLSSDLPSPALPQPMEAVRPIRPKRPARPTFSVVETAPADAATADPVPDALVEDEAPVPLDHRPDPAPNPALLARAQQMAARAKPDVAAE